MEDLDQRDEWEDLDEESLGDSDSSVELINEDEGSRRRTEIIKRGRIARAAAREREEKIRGDTCPSMPGARDPIAKEAPAVSQARRTSIGRAAKDQSPVQGGRLGKRKLSIESDPSKKGKSSTGEVMSAPGSSEDGIGELKKMMLELTAKVGAVHADIGLVRTDLSQRIEEGNKATLDLQRRMMLRLRIEWPQ